MQNKIIIKGAREHPAPNRELRTTCSRMVREIGFSIGDGAGNLKNLCRIR